MSRVTNNLQY